MSTVRGGHFRHLTNGKFCLCNSSLKTPPNRSKLGPFGSHSKVEQCLYISFLKKISAQVSDPDLKQKVKKLSSLTVRA